MLRAKLTTRCCWFETIVAALARGETLIEVV